MNQAALYRVLEEGRCSIQMFEDHPGFFGNWRVHFTKAHDRFEIEADNREGWLSLWQRSNDGTGKLLRQVPAAGEEGALTMLREWLPELEDIK
jgi:hypothetical protein